MRMAEPLLEIRNLSKRFEGVVALEDIGFTVQKGHISAVIGPNGAGKTTLFNLLTGMVKPDQGEVLLEGRRIDRLPAHAIARAGITRTFQNIEIFQNMTVVENVMAGRHLRTTSGWLTSFFSLPGRLRDNRQAFHRAMELLETFELTDRAFQPAGILPYGLQRMVEIARALAAEPKLLLLDEPMAGLNAGESRKLAAFMQEIRHTGVTILFIEHDMEMVMETADDIVVLDQGKMLAQGPPAAVQRDPRVIAAYLGEEVI
ncbi:leucine/isoleucine/valine transporter subunit; ATP-binding component of ABC superfamily [Kyrpidia spormannii]|uniref:Leucine/isoleucine/valine transporter subunit ATP-binding component of ABC superfamily n=3 Tax=Kyrpidia spormannii TaxID=2055160 RepID=A0ACA8ZA76_9BACL|nr:leucine/isoleucine/valine transporter subunit; ATP-binding component of ABC superfamily [Kyrpidia spormannii]CAB3393291.1 leucine/isoleucine/valine transporter subunit; ATP-binding component of ABC superfamily [Kyrpidia spormannii]